MDDVTRREAAEIVLRQLRFMERIGEVQGERMSLADRCQIATVGVRFLETGKLTTTRHVHMDGGAVATCGGVDGSPSGD
jgi:hypothetical protein